MNKGFVFSFEAIIALLLFATILLSMNFGKDTSLKELMILQQENDLLKVWSVNFPTKGEMINDTKGLFNNFELFLDNKKISGTKNGENSIASEATILDNYLTEHKIKIIVYFN